MKMHGVLVMGAASVQGNWGREETHPSGPFTFLNKLIYEKYLAQCLARGKCSINVILLLLSII